MEANTDQASFQGDGGSLFRIWVVNTLLSILTLGIYSAWAKVRTRKYIYSMIDFRGERLDYHADPRSILMGRFLLLLAIVIYSSLSGLPSIFSIIGSIFFVAAFPFLLLKSFQFSAKNTSYQNIRFSIKFCLKTAYAELAKKFIPLGCLLLLSSISMQFMGDDILVSLKSQGFSLKFIPVLFIGLLTFYFQYHFFIFFSHWVIKYSLGNLYYGSVKINFNSTLEEFKSQVLSPYIKKLFIFLGFILTITFLTLGATFLWKTSKENYGVILLVFQVALAFSLIVYAYYMTFYFQFLVQLYTWNRLESDLGSTSFDLPYSTLMKVILKNMTLSFLTFGLYHTWAKVNILEFILRHRYFHLLELSNIQSIQAESGSAFGDEVADYFDVDLDIGL